MELKVKHFSELGVYELHDIIKTRVDVFVVEQNCPYGELDGYDTESYHLWLEEDGKILSYLRVLPQGTKFDEVSIGRVLSLRRRQGLASILLREAVKVAVERFDADRIRLEAQTYAESLYEKSGFRRVSDEFFDEDGIPHVAMLWEKEQ